MTEYLAQLAPEASRIRELIKSNQLQSRSYIARKTDSLSTANEASQYQLKPGLAIITCCKVNLRPTPGYIGKPMGEIISIEQGTPARILDGPRIVDNLSWWRIECNINYKLIDYTHWKQKNFPRNLTVHSSDPSKAIIERSDDGTLVIFAWVVEKTPNGISQIREADTETLIREKHLLPDSPSFEVLGAQTFETMQTTSFQQEEQRETVTVIR